MTLQESGKVREIVQFVINFDGYPMRWDISDGKGMQLHVFDQLGPRSERELKELRASAIAELEEAMAEAGLTVEDLVELPMPRGMEPPDWPRVFASNGRRAA